MRLTRTALPVLLLLITALCANAANDIAAVVATAKPAVVTVTTYDAAGKQTGLGTGFFVDDSHVVTCYHVIDGATKAKIKTATGKTYQIKGIAASDRIADVVRLSLASPVKTAKSLVLCKSLPKQGEKVVVFGSPLGLELTVSDGIVSAIRDMPGVGKIIQITAPISPGSSGSPVLNLNGDAVGVVTSYMAEGQNLNFAVSSEQVLSLKPAVSGLADAPIPNAGETLWKKEVGAAYTYFIQEDWANALPHFEAMTRLKPSDVCGWTLTGCCYNSLGRYSDAINAFTQAVRIESNHAAAHYGLGVAYGELGRYQEALDAYKQATRITPDDPDAQYGLGFAYTKLGRSSDAVECFKQAIRMKPDDTRAHFGLGGAYCALGRYQEGVEAYKQAIRIKPDDGNAHYILGLTYALLLDDKGSALDEYKVLKNLDTEKASKLFNVIYP